MSTQKAMILSAVILAIAIVASPLIWQNYKLIQCMNHHMTAIESICISEIN